MNEESERLYSLPRLGTVTCNFR